MEVNPLFISQVLYPIEEYTSYKKHTLYVDMCREQLKEIRITFEYEKAAESNRLIAVKPTIHIDHVKGVSTAKSD